MADSKLVVRRTFLELVDETGTTKAGRRVHSAPPNLEAPLPGGSLAAVSADRLNGIQGQPPSVLLSSPAVPFGIQEVGIAEDGGITEGRPVKQGDWQTENDHCNESAEASTSHSLEGPNAQLMTTVILRNVPHAYTRHDLLDLLDSQGFAGLYDFVYLPVKFGSSSAFGYALVNFIEHDDAQRFRAHFQDFSSWNVPCSNTASVSWSKAHQGLTQFIERYRNSPMMNPSMPDECKPIILQNGVRVAFPPPTLKTIPQCRTERVRHSRKGEYRGKPSSVSSRNSEVSSNDHWKPGSVSSAASTPAGVPLGVATPMESLLFQGLTWLDSKEEKPKGKCSSLDDDELYQLTTQMICGSDCSSEQSFRSSNRSQITSSWRNGNGVNSPCSSRTKRSNRRFPDRQWQGAANWSNTILAAGLEAVPDEQSLDVAQPQKDVSQSQSPKDNTNPRRNTCREWCSAPSTVCGFGSSTDPSTTSSPAHLPASHLQEQYSLPQSQFKTVEGGPLLPGSIIKFVCNSSQIPIGEQAKVLVVDHAHSQYKVQLRDGRVCMVKARDTCFLR